VKSLRASVVGASVVLSSVLFSTSLPAETIWCEKFKIGCRSAADKEKLRQQCEREARGSFRRRLSWAIENEWSDEGWRVNGYKSASDQAMAGVRLSYVLCLKSHDIYE
jgi:hypothetical protein